MRRLLFNLLLGNGDAHAKNYALLRDGSELRMAPLYDLLCTQAYEGVDNFFAQKIGRATRYAEIESSDFALLESALGRLQAADRTQHSSQLSDAQIAGLETAFQQDSQRAAEDFTR